LEDIGLEEMRMNVMDCIITPVLIAQRITAMTAPIMMKKKGSRCLATAPNAKGTIVRIVQSFTAVVPVTICFASIAQNLAHNVTIAATKYAQNVLSIILVMYVPIAV
jgi:hypothetical protein